MQNSNKSPKSDMSGRSAGSRRRSAAVGGGGRAVGGRSAGGLKHSDLFQTKSDKQMQILKNESFLIKKPSVFFTSFSVFFVFCMIFVGFLVSEPCF